MEIEKAIEIVSRKTTIPNEGESFSDIEEAYKIAIAVSYTHLTLPTILLV